MGNLERLTKAFKVNIDEYKNQRYNETETRREFIDSFFSILGWDMNNSRGMNPRLREVMLENYLSSTSRPDYAFTLSGVKKFFVEAKKPSINIVDNKEAAFQARRYGWSAGHLIVVLTNFEYLLIYDCTIPPISSDEANIALLKKYHYSEYLSKIEDIKLLISKETVYSGQFERVIEPLVQNKQGAKQSIDEYFLKQINQWRIQLANYIYHIHPDYKLELINDLIQKFINQIVFLRICEDRDLIKYHSLLETTEDVNELKHNLDLVFREAEKRYSSGLFSGEYIIFDLSNDIIMDIIKGLYYPNSPYAFNVIESNLLGQIYELFLCDRLQTENNKIVLVKRDGLQSRDIVSTPTEIVKYMINKSLKPILKNKKPDEIFDLRFADISCGSGIFLLEVFDYIIYYCINWYMNNDPDYLIHCDNGQYNIPFQDKKRILNSCIYGIDIDTNAVEIAKFSILVKLLENETIPSLGNNDKLLPNLDNNIKAGNSLVDFSDVNRLNNNIKDKIFPFDWNFNNDTSKFDAIIGNPPYVSTEDMLNLLVKEEFKIYKRYKTAQKQFDKYFIFIERGLSRLKSNGILCYIVPNKFSKVESGESLRELLAVNKKMVEYIDFGSAHLFRGNLSYSSIIILKNESQDIFNFEEVSDLQKWWAGLEYNRVKYFTNTLTKHKWLLVTDDRKANLINKLYEGTVPLMEVAKPINGIQTSAERPVPIFWFSSDDVISEDNNYFKIKRNDTEYLIEKSILKPYFKPVKLVEKGVTSYDAVTTNKWIIFPYDEFGQLYSEDIMLSNYEKTWDYLNDYYMTLLPKKFKSSGGGRDVPHATPETWYHYGRIQHLTSFINTPKLIVRVMRSIDKPLYYYDSNNWMISAGGTAGYCAIIEYEDKGYKLEFIQAILNHPAMGWLCSIIGSDFGGDFFSNGTYILNEIPIKNMDFSNPSQLNLYNQTITLARRIYDINNELLKGQLTNRKAALLNNEKESIIKEVQDVITTLYGIEGYEEIIK